MAKKKSKNKSEVVIETSIEAKPKDYLTALTPELQQMIIGYLFATHEPDKALKLRIHNGEEPSEKTTETLHPLDCVAATCKSLRGEVMGFAERFLFQHSDIANYNAFQSPKLQANRNFLRGQGGLLKWASKHCVFCGRQSGRSAIMMNGLRCCFPCDVKHWPGKITKSMAKDRYDLRDHQLLPDRHPPPKSKKTLAKYPAGLSKPKYGTYMSQNVLTTVFLTSEIEILAYLAHGDMKAHMAKLQEEREERRRKTAATRAKNTAAKRAVDIANANETLAVQLKHRRDFTSRSPEAEHGSFLNPVSLIEDDDERSQTNGPIDLTDE